MADRLLVSPAVVSLVGVPTADTSLRTGDVIRRADGTIVGATTDQARYCTIKLVETERRIIDSP